MGALVTLLPGTEHVQNLHPLVVHFPIALLCAAALLYGLAWLGGRDSLAWTGLWMLGLGTLGAAISVATGLRGQAGVMVAPSVREHLLEYHQWLMIATLALSVLLAAWSLYARPMPERGRLAFLLLLLVMLGVLTKGADYGARMVYDYNAGGNACAQPIDFTR